MPYRKRSPGYELRPGQTGELVETLEEGAAFLVEFGQSSPNSCEWMGVLYASEVELQANGAIAA